MDKDSKKEDTEHSEHDVPREKALGDISLLSLDHDSRRFIRRYDDHGLEGLCEDFNRRFLEINNHDPDFGTGIEKVEKLRQKSFDRISAKYRKELARTGLGVELTRPWGSKWSGEGEEPNGNNFPLEKFISFKVENAKRFVSYLDALIQNEDVKTGQILALYTVVGDLYFQLLEDYDLHAADDEHVVEFLANIGIIAERLGVLVKKHSGVLDEYECQEEFSDDIESLKTFSALSKARYLREFIVANRANLIESDEACVADDGTIRWVFRSHPDRLSPAVRSVEEFKNGLESSVNAVFEVGRNPNASVLHAEILARLLQNMLAAKKVLQEIRPEDWSADLVEWKRNQIMEKQIVLDEQYERLKKGA